MLRFINIYIKVVDMGIWERLEELNKKVSELRPLLIKIRGNKRQFCLFPDVFTFKGWKLQFGVYQVKSKVWVWRETEDYRVSMECSNYDELVFKSKPYDAFEQVIHSKEFDEVIDYLFETVEEVRKILEEIALVEGVLGGEDNGYGREKGFGK